MCTAVVQSSARFRRAVSGESARVIVISPGRTNKSKLERASCVEYVTASIIPQLLVDVFLYATPLAPGGIQL